MISGRRNSGLRRFWRFAGWSGVLGVVCLSMAPVPPEAVAAAGGDKLLHGLGYGLLAAWFAQLHPDSRGRMRVFGGLVLLGAGVELLQGLVPWRDMELADLAADAIGAALGLLATLGPGGRLLAAR